MLTQLFSKQGAALLFSSLLVTANAYIESCESSQGEVKVATDHISNRHGKPKPNAVV